MVLPADPTRPADDAPDSEWQEWFRSGEVGAYHRAAAELREQGIHPTIANTARRVQHPGETLLPPTEETS